MGLTVRVSQQSLNGSSFIGANAHSLKVSYMNSLANTRCPSPMAAPIDGRSAFHTGQLTKESTPMHLYEEPAPVLIENN